MVNLVTATIELKLEKCQINFYSNANDNTENMKLIQVKTKNPINLRLT